LIILQTKRIQTKTDPNTLSDVLAWFDQFQSAPVPANVWMQCQLALIEGFTNAVRHAHANLDEQTPVEIEVTVSVDAIDMRIWDHGPGFDLEQILQSKLKVVDHESEGGRGLKIMYQVADKLTYQRLSDRRNCLHLHKRFSHDQVLDV
jgi:serine/threonine-protein kinase RsbW